MATVYTIDGPSRRGRLKGERCKRVKMGGKGNRGCTIELCKVGRRWKFQKGTRSCH